ncbi:MAG: class I SAM-dependent methyltransferase [Synergistaceae bacterium]|nr:class I SAM-dependent methyltransferase [Synergistaceae bacterium]
MKMKTKTGIETEVFGVSYERFALAKRIEKLCRTLNIRTVAELPAHGAKAAPSLYSLGFGLQGKEVTLVNGAEEYKKEWERLGLGNTVRFVRQEDILHTDFREGSFDFVWNFAFIPTARDPDALIEEMKRISRRYVAVFSVNAGNVGCPIHSALHKINKIPWTHGDRRYNRRAFLAERLRAHGLSVVEKGFIDCPLWPDSPGFRDMRLHKHNITFESAEWRVPYAEMLREKKFPAWMKLMYAWESIPMPPFIKTLYAHIFYAVAEK